VDVKTVREIREKNEQIRALILDEADYLEENGWTRCQVGGRWKHPDSKASYWHTNAVRCQRSLDGGIWNHQIRDLLKVGY